MPTTEIKYSLQPNLTREAVRKNLIQLFMDEHPGTGKQELCSRYIYEVDRLADSTRVLLKRPAPLNKGVDFEVHIEGIKFRGKGPKKSMPSHDNVIDDLAAKQKENSSEYSKVKEIINKLYKCNDVADSEMCSLQFTQGHAIEAILKAVKWLFIEQDVTYWNWSGRHMLWSSLHDERLC